MEEYVSDVEIVKTGDFRCQSLIDLWGHNIIYVIVRWKRVIYKIV